jgi:hypothetical protein
MIFVETPIFTAAANELLTDDDYSAFQQFLIVRPRAGQVIPGAGGLRKVRWSAPNAGKRGGVRVIYYVVDEAEQIRLLLIYKKGVKDDLTPTQKKLLRAIKDKW